MINMKSNEFENIALSFFPNSTLNYFNDGLQYGFNNFIDKEIKRIGYCVNLTIDVINQAKNNNIDLILTHHNIWEDFYELREDCLKLLKEYKIIHYYNHLPLDCAPFGPTRALSKELDVKIVEDFSKLDGFSFGVVGEFIEPITLSFLVDKVEKLLNHKIRYWKNNDKEIKRIGIVCGSGGDLESLHEAVLLKCDAYLTGEKKLKTLLYAKHNKMNFLLGSHTFTEIYGITQYAKLIKEKLCDIEIIKLNDEYIE